MIDRMLAVVAYMFYSANFRELVKCSTDGFFSGGSSSDLSSMKHEDGGNGGSNCGYKMLQVSAMQKNGSGPLASRRYHHG